MNDVAEGKYRSCRDLPSHSNSNVPAYCRGWNGCHNLSIAPTADCRGAAVEAGGAGALSGTETASCNGDGRTYWPDRRGNAADRERFDERKLSSVTRDRVFYETHS